MVRQKEQFYFSLRANVGLGQKLVGSNFQETYNHRPIIVGYDTLFLVGFPTFQSYCLLFNLCMPHDMFKSKVRLTTGGPSVIWEFVWEIKSLKLSSQTH